MKHPDPTNQPNQETALASLPPEMRAAQAQLFRVGNASMHYYADMESFNPFETDWMEWLEVVLMPAQAHFRSLGSKHARHTWRSSAMSWRRTIAA